MRFLLAAMGSHGDVHPFIGIAQALQRDGHQVRLAAQAAFADLIEAAGVTPVPVGAVDDYAKLAADPDLWHPRRGAEVVWRTVLDTLGPAYDALDAAATAMGGEVTMVSSTLAWAGLILAEARGLRSASVHLQPVVFYSTEAMPLLPGVPPIVRRLPRSFKARFYDGADRYALDPKIAPRLNAFRAEKGLPAVSGVMRGFIHAPDLVLGMWPAWYAPPASDWPGQVELAGFPLYDEADVTPLPADVAAFLDEGEPPVAFTPGSAMTQGGRFFRAAADACRLNGCRGLLLTRHPEQVPPDLPPGVRHVAYAPFGSLLPRCRALVHHGGIGTASQALKAGCPTVVVPMSHDQFDNADRLQKLGGSVTLKPRWLTGRRLAAKLRRVLDAPATDAATAGSRRRLADENGCATAAELLAG